MMLVYSLAVTLALGVSAPWWGWRMLTVGRYRAGLSGRLGRITSTLRAVCLGKRVVWVHAVSVGEVLAVERLVAELGQALGPDWLVVVSTTTDTGQKIAQERFGAERVFWFPLDFAFAVRACLRAFKPELLVLVEGELWPRVLFECERAGVPVAVVNARVSDRSYRRTLRVKTLWLSMARRVRLWLAQGQETAQRLRTLGVSAVSVPGNLKFDLPPGSGNEVSRWIGRVADGRPVIVAGSTLPGRDDAAPGEEEVVLHAWKAGLRHQSRALLVLAPRHPQRFDQVFATAAGFRPLRASLRDAGETHPSPGGLADIILLDTLGDLAGVYSVADVAFVGGSLVGRGGHNPLEPARFGVPVIMGPSYENFREIVDGMQAADAIRIADAAGLADALAEALRAGKPMGARGRDFFERQAGATERSVTALIELLPVEPARA